MSEREIKIDHHASPVTQQLRVRVMDKPGPGGAPHDYLIEQRDGRRSWLINFQNGPLGEVGVNGLTHEVLIAIVMDRLDCFQKGDFACQENAEAFHHLDMALGWLGSRTKRRVGQGIEGTMQPDPVEDDLGKVYSGTAAPTPALTDYLNEPQASMEAQAKPEEIAALRDKTEANTADKPKGGKRKT